MLKGPRCLAGGAAQALADVRPALAITSAILIGLSCTLLASEFSMNRTMGAVLGPIVALAWIADAMLLPALAGRIAARRAH